MFKSLKAQLNGVPVRKSPFYVNLTFSTKVCLRGKLMKIENDSAIILGFRIMVMLLYWMVWATKRFGHLYNITPLPNILVQAVGVCAVRKFGFFTYTKTFQVMYGQIVNRKFKSLIFNCLHKVPWKQSSKNENKWKPLKIQ